MIAAMAISVNARKQPNTPGSHYRMEFFFVTVDACEYPLGLTRIFVALTNSGSLKLYTHPTAVRTEQTPKKIK